jgi:hypothetical protein
MRKLFYNYYMPMRHLFKFESDIETFDDWHSFRKEWDNDEQQMIIIPLSSFDLIGLDIRFQFRYFARDNKKRFLLVGTQKQIEFALSQNERFLNNLIDQVTLPLPFDVLELAILKKINILEKSEKEKKSGGDA